MLTTPTRQEILDELKQPLEATRVAKRKGAGNMELSYLQGYDVISSLNEIFGFDGWSDRLISLDFVADVGKGEMWRASVEISVMIGERAVAHADTGVGISRSKNAEEIEKAIKEAVTDALKRAARKFGDQFGNSLYDKDAPEHKGEQREKLATTPQLTRSETARAKAVELGFRTPKGAVPAPLADGEEERKVTAKTRVYEEFIAVNDKARVITLAQSEVAETEQFKRFLASASANKLPFAVDADLMAFENATSKHVEFPVIADNQTSEDWNAWATLIDSGSLRWPE